MRIPDSTLVELFAVWLVEDSSLDNVMQLSATYHTFLYSVCSITRDIPLGSDVGEAARRVVDVLIPDLDSSCPVPLGLGLIFDALLQRKQPNTVEYIGKCSTSVSAIRRIVCHGG